MGLGWGGRGFPDPEMQQPGEPHGEYEERIEHDAEAAAAKRERIEEAEEARSKTGHRPWWRRLFRRR